MSHKHFLRLAIEEAKRSKDSDGYHVGAVIVRSRKIIAKAYSDETQNNGHAEGLVIKKARKDLSGSTLYVTMEPCSRRPSGKASCVDLILSYGITRVVYGTRDPEIYVPCEGIEILLESEIEVVHLKELEKACRNLTPTLFDKP